MSLIFFFQWDMYRQLFQTRVPDDIVRKLENSATGVEAVVMKIEKEYAVRTVYHNNGHMVLVSPSVEMLELVLDTLEERYGADAEDKRMSVDDLKNEDIETEEDVDEEGPVRVDDDGVSGDNENVSGNEAADKNLQKSQHPMDAKSDTLANVHQDGIRSYNKEQSIRATVTEIRNRHLMTLERSPSRAMSRSTRRVRENKQLTKRLRTETLPVRLNPGASILRSSLKSQDKNFPTKNVYFQE